MLEEGDEENMDEDDDDELYFPHELTSPEPIYEYGRDVPSPRTVSEPSPDYSGCSSELTFSECVIIIIILL